MKTIVDVDIANPAIGKELARVEYVTDHQDDWLAFTFTDGSKLQLRFSWIYEMTFEAES